MSTEQGSAASFTKDPAKLSQKAKWLRQTLLEMLIAANQGHPGSVMSEAEILSVLYYGGYLRYRPGKLDDPGRDRFIVSKGHATMGVYPILADIGFFPRDELMKMGKPGAGILRMYGNNRIPGVDATAGSLGHGVGIGAGMALAAKLDGRDQRVGVLIGEGELYEGSVWEAALFAAHHRLQNLVVVMDRNRRIILGDTEELLALDPITQKFDAFGWRTFSVDGHSPEDLVSAFDAAFDRPDGRPTIVVAETTKGRGISFMEGRIEWHYWQGMNQDQQFIARDDLVRS